jgi:hypothetical protein
MDVSATTATSHSNRHTTSNCITGTLSIFPLSEGFGVVVGGYLGFSDTFPAGVVEYLELYNG